MGPQDFLRIKAQTPLREACLAAGVICEVSTNFEPILEAVRATFIKVEDPHLPRDLGWRFWVDTAQRSSPPWPKPHFRGLDHLVFAGFDAANSLLIDLRARRATGRFAPEMAADRTHWMRVVFPVLVTIFGATVGTIPLHCGCVEKNGRAVLLTGKSGAGKSTLTLALAQSGFAFLSDDWTYFSERDGRLVAWGLPTAVKLLAEAGAYFPELAGQVPSVTMNGKRGFEVDPETLFQVRRSRCAEPRWVIFLERHPSYNFRLTEMPPAEAAARLRVDLLAEEREATRNQDAIIQKLVERPSWLLQYRGTPQEVAHALADFCGTA